MVWPAVDESTGRPVAVKVVHEHLAADPDTRSRLSAAAGFAGASPHPALLEPIGVFSEHGRWFLVTPRVDGASLDTVEPLAPARAIALGLDLVGAVRALHRARRIHGDVRPGNVLVGSDGPKLIDSGFGRPVGASGVLPGRPGQTPPEVLAGQPPSAVGDLYGVGVVLYRALAGKPPWTGPSAWAVLAAQRAGRPQPPPGPAGLTALVLALLDPDPRRRPQDAATVERALRRLRADPAARVDLGSRWLLPIRPGGAWVVHCVDPATGEPALIRVNLGRRRAHAVAARLRAEGWDVTAERDSLGGPDLLWTAAAATIGWFVVPVIGAILALAVVGTWRARGVRPELRRLPPVQAPVPPIVALPGAEVAVVAGLLLLAAAVTLLLAPQAAILPLAAVVGLAVWTLRRPVDSAAERVARGRVQTAFAEVRRLIDHRPHPLDTALAMEGELAALERSWGVGEIEARELVGRLDGLRVRAASTPAIPLLQKRDP